MKLSNFISASAFKLTAVAISAVALFAYSEKMAERNPRKDRVHVTYWEGWTAFEFEAMAAIVADFNRSQDRIQVDILSESDAVNKTMMSISAGLPPDVAGLGNPDIAHFVDDHALMPLDDFCKEKGINRSQYTPIFWDMGVYQGHVWSLPSVPASTALFYNPSMFSQVGLKPDAYPKTIEELDALDVKLSKLDGEGRIKQIGFLPSEPGWWTWAFGYYFGGKLIDADGNLTVNSKENIRGFDWVASFSKRHGSDAVQSFKQGLGNFSSPQNAFMAQQVVMEMQGVWMYNFIHTFNPSLSWRVVPFPHPADRPDMANVTMVEENNLTIPRGAKHPREAFEFIAFVQQQKEMEKLCCGQLKFSPLSKVTPEFYQKNPNPSAKFFYELSGSPNSVPAPKVGYWQEFQSELSATIDSITLLSRTPKEALDHLQERMKPKVESYRQRVEQRRRLGL